MSTNLVDGFFKTGGALSQRDLSYVVRRADQELPEALMRGEFCYVLTTRQMGKTSLVYRTKDKLNECGATVVVLDLTRVGKAAEPETWYKTILFEIGRSTGLRQELTASWNDNSSLTPIRRCMNAIEEVVLARASGPLVIFVDEIDFVRNLSFATGEFFGAIRACYNRRPLEPDLERLTFCMVGVATPSDLIDDVLLTPFNIGRRIDLDDFKQEEAATLEEGLKGNYIDCRAVVNRIYHWTHGHPYLTQRLCSAIESEIRPNKLVGTDRSDPHGSDLVDCLCESVFFSSTSTEDDPNLSFVQDRLCKNLNDKVQHAEKASGNSSNPLETRVANLLRFYEKVLSGRRVMDDESVEYRDDLRLSGIVRSDHGLLKVRNRIYERVFDKRWIANEMPGSEIRRQKRAFRMGVRRGGFAAAAIFSVGILAWTAFKEWARAEKLTLVASEAVAHGKDEVNRARLEKERSNTMLLYAGDMRTALQAWRDHDGVAARLLERYLPRSGQADYRDFVWWYLWRLCHSERETFRGFAAQVWKATFSPDGRFLAAASQDNTTRIWNFNTKTVIAVLHGTQPFNALAFSPDGKVIATGGDDGFVRLWRSPDGIRLGTLQGQQPGGVLDVKFAGDGKTLASSGADATIHLWHTESRRPIGVLRGDASQLNNLSFSPNGRFIAAASMNRSIGLWDVATQRLIRWLPGHSAAVQSVAFAPDGHTLVSCSADGNVYLWGMTHPYKFRVVRKDVENPLSVAFTPDGKAIAVGCSDGTVLLVNVATHQVMTYLFGHTAPVTSVTFSPDGRFVVATSEDRTVKSWLVYAPSLESIEVSSPDPTLSAAFSPDSHSLALGSARGQVRFVDTKTLRETSTLKVNVGRVTAVAFIPKGQIAVATCLPPNPSVHHDTYMVSDPILHIFEFQGRPKEANLPGTVEWLRCLNASPDGRLLVACSGTGGSAALLFDAPTGKLIGPVTGNPKDTAIWAEFSPDGRKIALCGIGRVILWDVAKHRALAASRDLQIPAHRVAFSPDGRSLACAKEGGNIEIVNLTAQGPTHASEIATSQVYSLAFSSDGRRIVGAVGSRGLKLWDVESGREVAAFPSGNSPVETVTFSRNGRMLVAVDKGGTVALWSTASESDVENQK